jgi:hypothetical protein
MMPAYGSKSATGATPLTGYGARPVVFWAVLGGVMLLFQLFVLGKWITGPNFVPTGPGPDTISEARRLLYVLVQIVVPLATLVMFWSMLIKPWLREGRMTTDGRLIIAAGMVFFWDMSMNYSSTVLFYNSHLVNFGSWSLGSWPTWFSPKANLLPEPVFVAIPGYTCMVFAQALFICWLLRKAKARHPQLGVAAILGLIVVGLTIVDSIIEIVLIRTEIYAYPGAIHAVTLFAGETYQFPLTEGFLFGGLGVGAIAALHFFRDDKGQTFAERGIEKIRYGDGAKQWIRFLAVYGFVHGAFFALYTLPNQIISVNTDPFPEGYPSYMHNGMCVYGFNRDECPGPGVMMPRPPH